MMCYYLNDHFQGQRVKLYSLACTYIVAHVILNSDLCRAVRYVTIGVSRSDCNVRMWAGFISPHVLFSGGSCEQDNEACRRNVDVSRVIIYSRRASTPNGEHSCMIQEIGFKYQFARQLPQLRFTVVIYCPTRQMEGYPFK
jgi:hypothetical protein